METKHENTPHGKTTVQILQEILDTTNIKDRKTPMFTIDDDDDDVDYNNAQLNIDCDEVYPNVYIGDEITAMNKEYLQSLGITHLLNSAKEIKFLNPNEKYYKDTTIEYLALPLADRPSTDISKHFDTAADFIHAAVSSGGKVFVHCQLGISRSATLVLAYLMIKEGLSAVDAIKTVRENRYIQPNKGFLTQLSQLDNQLRLKRSQKEND